jgi:hypothetical protein
VDCDHRSCLRINKYFLTKNARGTESLTRIAPPHVAILFRTLGRSGASGNPTLWQDPGAVGQYAIVKDKLPETSIIS